MLAQSWKSLNNERRDLGSQDQAKQWECLESLKVLRNIIMPYNAAYWNRSWFDVNEDSSESEAATQSNLTELLCSSAAASRLSVDMDLSPGKVVSEERACWIICSILGLPGKSHDLPRPSPQKISRSAFISWQQSSTAHLLTSPADKGRSLCPPVINGSGIKGKPFPSVL